jgi:hypothetical protein
MLLQALDNKNNTTDVSSLKSANEWHLNIKFGLLFE